MYINCNIEVRSRNHVCPGRTINITYSVHVSVALVIKNAKRLHRFNTYGLPAATIFFFILSHKPHDFRKKWLLNIKYL
jgi:hypothetical protein